jgi:hypothetical protein
LHFECSYSKLQNTDDQQLLLSCIFGIINHRVITTYTNKSSYRIA